MTHSIADLCERAHTTAKLKGWLDKPRSWAGTTSLMVSELSEALEDYRGNKKLNETYFEFFLETGAKSILSQENYKRLDDEQRLLAKPCGIPIELADFVIRVAQHCGTEKWDLAHSMDVVSKLSEDVKTSPVTDFEELIAEMTLNVSFAYAVGRGISLPEGYPDEAVSFLAAATQEAFNFCQKNDIDLWAAIEAKEKFNGTRSHRHGGKKI